MFSALIATLVPTDIALDCCSAISLPSSAYLTSFCFLFKGLPSSLTSFSTNSTIAGFALAAFLLDLSTLSLT